MVPQLVVEIVTLLELVDGDRRPAEDDAIDGGLIEERLFGSVGDLLEELVFLAVSLAFESLRTLTASTGFSHHLALEGPIGNDAFAGEATEGGTASFEDNQTVHL